MSGGLVVCASTVKDTLANLQRYVDGNLAGGADHLVVFLDAPDDPATPEVRDFLDAHPHVTCVVTDDVLVDRQAARAAQHPPADQRQRRQGPADHRRLGGMGLPRRRRRDRAARPCRARLRARLPAGGEPGTAGGRLAQAVGRRPDLVQAAARARRPDAAQDPRRHRPAGQRRLLPRPRRGEVRPPPDHGPVADAAPRGRRRQERGRDRSPTPLRCGCCTTSRSPARSSSASGPRSWPPGRSRTSGRPASPPRSPCRP